MQPNLVMVFKGRHIVPPYLNYIDRSPRFVVQLFEKGDVAILPFDKAVMCLYGDIADELNPLNMIRRAATQ